MKTIRQQLADIDQKICDLTIKKTALEAKLSAEVNFDHIVPGAVIQFAHGKGEGRRTIEGTVVATKPADPAQPRSTPMVKVAFGEGFEAQFATTYFSTVTKVVSSPAAAPAEAPAA